MTERNIKVGLVGLGTVGSGVWTMLEQHRDLLKNRVGASLEISRVLVRDLKKKREVKIPQRVLTTRIEDVLEDSSVSMIVEVTGDVEASRHLALKAFQAGKHFITANKALLAIHGKEIFAAARKAQVDVCFEAAVGGGIPVLRALREGYVGNQIQAMYGILNGTCNFILSEMSSRGAEFGAVLQEAQRLGYAEADPSFDIDGIDASHKLAILMAIAHGAMVDLSDIFVEGLRSITALDLQMARQFGYEIKLLAISKQTDGKVQARVHPTMVPKSSMLAAVQGVHNALLVEGDFVGDGLLYGRGAGSYPTASAVVGDIVEVARNILAGVGYTVPPLGTYATPVRNAKVAAMGDLVTSYYLRFQAIDRPGILAKITNILSQHRISISSVYQHVREEGKEIPVVVLTHGARERDIQAAVKKIDRLAGIAGATTLIRVEGSCR